MSQEFSLNIQRKIVKWYLQCKRDLPWRHVKDPYRIWISEIILQQTRVVQGYNYYLNFIEAFPSVQILAQAEEDEVLKMWQGLGYYSRARNLHFAAKTIVSEFNGVFPSDYKSILSLKGIGVYTAAAIASFAFDLPHAVVDGNVYRVLSRLFAIDIPIDSTQGKKYFAELAEELLDRGDPGLHNQSLMEFGALQCVPVSPKCEVCPLSSFCLAYASGKVSKYPVKQGKIQVKERFFNYLDIRCGNYLYLQKRTGNDIWKNLYELPLIETDVMTGFESLQENEVFKKIFQGARKVVMRGSAMRMKHVLSHRIVYADFYRIEVENDSYLKKYYVKVEMADLDKFAVSRLVHRYFEKSDEVDLFQ